jgi:hypothetical protein
MDLFGFILGNIRPFGQKSPGSLFPQTSCSDCLIVGKEGGLLSARGPHDCKKGVPTLNFIGFFHVAPADHAGSIFGQPF